MCAGVGQKKCESDQKSARIVEMLRIGVFPESVSRTIKNTKSVCRTQKKFGSETPHCSTFFDRPSNICRKCRVFCDFCLFHRQENIDRNSWKKGRRPDFGSQNWCQKRRILGSQGDHFSTKANFGSQGDHILKRVFYGKNQKRQIFLIFMGRSAQIRRIDCAYLELHWSTLSRSKS